MEKETDLKEVASQYLEFLLSGKRNHASQLIMELAAAKIPVKDIYLQVFQPAQGHEEGLAPIGCK
ncbi:MAG: hypothetical protein EOO24_18820 [Comamonadaceae bacterium]|nr:MAG: hypothetical protein EOO24_18820 [Comamonadaceae bacterium]